MLYIILLSYFLFSESFLINLHKNNRLNSNIFCEKKNNKDEIKILNIDYNEIINTWDKLALNNLENDLPKSPESEEEIEDDSFEGYLKTEFYGIINHKKFNEPFIYFYDFYMWRVEKIGTLWTFIELSEMYDALIGNGKKCDLMNFILLNKIIYENDGADF